MRAISIASLGRAGQVTASSVASAGILSRLTGIIIVVRKEVVRLYSYITRSIILRSTINADN